MYKMWVIIDACIAHDVVLINTLKMHIVQTPCTYYTDGDTINVNIAVYVVDFVLRHEMGETVDCRRN